MPIKKRIPRQRIMPMPDVDDETKARIVAGFMSGRKDDMREANRELNDILKNVGEHYKGVKIERT